jgi:fructose-1,6-bisphosphatase/inositol monophosphatase family enzyme
MAALVRQTPNRRGPDRVDIPAPAPADPSVICGAALTGSLDPATRSHVEAVARRFTALGPGPKYAGLDCPRLADGEQDFLLDQRTLPWDHAQGTLLVATSGDAVHRSDSTPYLPTDAPTPSSASSPQRTSSAGK